LSKIIVIGLLAACMLAVLLRKIQVRLQLSRAKHRSLAGHSRMARRFAGLVPFYEYGEDRVFRADGAPDPVAAARRAGFMRLAGVLAARAPKNAALTASVIDAISDLEFTSRYRVPFQFSRFVRAHLKSGAFVESSAGVSLTDIDGNRLYDLTGSYGVNVFGYDFYKECIARGSERVRDLGPVLGAYHPIVAYNVRRLLAISAMDEISFHMSGTEAVMQAVRLARYHTRRSHLVRFCGAYHGWWGDVQPGIGNPLAARETYTLKDMDEAALKVLRTRRDIACVLVNPLQALHPNANAPGDSALVDSGRSAHFDRAAYGAWLAKLREVCSARGIVLIFDEVFVGFRLGVGRRPGIFRRAGRHGYLRKDRRRRVARRRIVRPPAIHAPFSRRPPGRHLLCPGHVQRAPLRHGRHGRVSGAPGDAADAVALPGSRRGMERARREAQRAVERGAAAGQGREPLDDLDGLLPATVALQLDVSILFTRGGNRLELGGDGAPDLQPELHGRGLRAGRRPIRVGGPRDEAGRLVVGRT
jgi:hypothetical protein